MAFLEKRGGLVPVYVFIFPGEVYLGACPVTGVVFAQNKHHPQELFWNYLSSYTHNTQMGRIRLRRVQFQTHFLALAEFQGDAVS